MAKKINILVACGSGVATSTLASKKVEEVCKEYNLEYSIETCSMSGVQGLSKNFDVVLTTNKYDKPLDVPVMSVTPFITGIRMDKTKKELGELLKKISED
ncbi:PTS sugar transporter subunit IIB [Faecalicoccus pleomorphus]|uniref:PTS sugar transporter subunit IIB n=1 Tax=Faecalicoccus pleomorphus TaxID=1323 RepID=A0A7X9NGD4_9FIRM|nr:PTS sugar transporter subunit IIB [Faecalicoccus pleomorphus]MDB7979921.1 PTS sugar transporter subunit IIB [Faecalicoccus pleomorphus]MDB7982184.1 PTS sugar transporter subunit IIB [Faecalicoccus pleomorphus]NME43767.1 PTS sugar transporter subunit IIB [Faecalicoccus pleomorphus]